MNCRQLAAGLSNVFPHVHAHGVLAERRSQGSESHLPDKKRIVNWHMRLEPRGNGIWGVACCTWGLD
jgi:hypothetical protein